MCIRDSPHILETTKCSDKRAQPPRVDGLKTIILGSAIQNRYIERPDQQNRIFGTKYQRTQLDCCAHN